MKKIVLLQLLGLLFLPTLTHAAEMYLILDKTEITEKSPFSGTVYISTGGLPINNAEATIHFPTDLLNVESVSTSGSIFNIWVEQPYFSNTDGKIYFNGGLPTPGYAGQSGTALKINFRAKKIGVADIAFGSPAVRANDGKGTDVLSQTRGSSISITEIKNTVVPTVKTQTETTPGLPKAPVITSENMPDQDAWYSKTQGTFSWKLPSDVTVTQLILSESEKATPSIAYNPPISSKTLTELEDGAYYLNARFKNASGWGGIGSRKIQIDTTEPEKLSIKTVNSDEDLVQIDASARDELSGIKKYVVYKDSKELTEAAAYADGKAQFTLPPLTEGTTKLIVRAYDKAGNHSETEISVDVPETKAPKITRYPEYVKIGTKIEIRGKSPYAGVDINLWIKEEGRAAKSYLVKSDDDKVFSYTSDSTEVPGIVSIWAETIRGANIKSAYSEKIYVSVKESDVVWLGTRAIQIISIAITLIVLIFLVLILIYGGIKKMRALKRKLRRDLAHTEQDVHKVFEILKSDTRRHIKMLEKASSERKLTKEETKIYNELSEGIEETEKYLSDKIRKIEQDDL
jgi:hypothetical protein